MPRLRRVGSVPRSTVRPAAALALVLLAAPPVKASEQELLRAVRAGDVAAVKALLDKGVPVDTRFRYDRTYLTGEDGDVFVLSAGPKPELLASNPMGEVLMATPAISDRLLLVRGLKHLFAIEGTASETGASKPASPR